MTVADLQKYLRALSEAVGASKAASASKDLADAADRLGPFSPMSVADLARFLELAWEYKTTGKVSTPEPATVRKSSAAAAAKKSGVPDPAAALLKVKDLHARALEPSVTRELVEREVGSLSGLQKAQLEAVAAGCGFTQKFKTKADLIKALVGYVMGRKGAYERSDA